MTNPTNRRRWLSGGAVFGCPIPASADSAQRTPFDGAISLKVNGQTEPHRPAAEPVGADR